MYNCKVYDYGAEKQYRFYTRAMKSKGEDNNKEKIKELKEEYENEIAQENTENKQVKSVDIERSIKSSLNRTVNKIYEYARANQWEYFVTLTFNSKINRYDYGECAERVKCFLHDLREDNPDMKYILVPELHEDGAYHFHGLFSNIPNVEIKDSGRYSYGKYVFKRENIPPNLLGKCRLIYNMGKYYYGYSDIQKCQSSEKSANYITKYITKELVKATKGKKRYWHSKKNLDKPKVTEMLLEQKHKEQIKELINDKIIFEKSVNIDVNGYENTIEYIDIKTEIERE